MELSVIKAPHAFIYQKPSTTIQDVITSLFRVPGFKETKAVATLKNYIGKAKQLFAFANHYGVDRNINLFDFQIYKLYIVYLKSKGLKNKTINSNLSFLKVILIHASKTTDYNFEFIDGCYKLKEEGKSLIQRVNGSFTLGEVKMLLHYYSNKMHDPCSLRMLVMLLIMFDTGMRISELHNLDIENIHRDLSVITYRMEKVSREHHGILSGITLKVIDRFLIGHRSNAKKGPLFTGFDKMNKRFTNVRLTKEGIRGIIISLSNTVFDGRVKTNPHKFRHTCANLMVQNGADSLLVKKTLGHSTKDVTGIYMDSLETQIISHRKYAILNNLKGENNE